MESTDRQIKPGHWVFAIGDEKKRQYLVKYLKREKNPDNREPQIHAGNRYDTCCGNR